MISYNLCTDLFSITGPRDCGRRLTDTPIIRAGRSAIGIDSGKQPGQSPTAKSPLGAAFLLGQQTIPYLRSSTVGSAQAVVGGA